MIPKDKLNEIKDQNTWECFTKILQNWLKLNPTATWNKLIEALKNIGQKPLAETIRCKYLQGTCTYVALCLASYVLK